MRHNQWMPPLVRNCILLYALTGISVIGWLTIRAVAFNFTAMRSWHRIEGWVTYTGFPVRIFPSKDWDVVVEADHSSIPIVAVDHNLFLPTNKTVALFQDPNDPNHLKTAGFVQMWLFPAAMTGWILTLTLIAAGAIWLGQGDGHSGQSSAAGQWMHSRSPGSLPDGVVLRSPPSYWNIALCWSLLGIPAVLAPWIVKESGNRITHISLALAGSAYVLGVWGVAWRDVSLELSANAQGIRMSSLTGWRDVPWEMVHGVENQSIFRTYQTPFLGMMELPFPGAALNVYAFTDANDRTLISFGRELVPNEGMAQLFKLCKTYTGHDLTNRDVPTVF